MEKVRFACPRCHTIMQTGAEKVGYDVACPHCAHRFRLVESAESSSSLNSSASGDAATMPHSTRIEDNVTHDFGSTSQLSDATTDHGDSVPYVSTFTPAPKPAGKLPSGDFPGVSVPTGGRVGSRLGQAAVIGPVRDVVPPRFACPYCLTTAPPRWKSEVSTVGWVVFATLLVTTCVFCFVGLFIRDKYQVCSKCKIRLN